jgi:hypothetical protein
MKIKDIVKEAKAHAPLVLSNMPDRRAARLAVEVLSLIRAEIAVTDEGRVGVPGLGTFKMRQLAVTRNGEETTVKQVVFSPAPARVKKTKVGSKR